MTLDKTEAQRVLEEIEFAIDEGRVVFLKLGMWFCLAKTKRHWVELGYESWGQYCENFHFKVKYVNNLIALYEWKTKLGLPDEQVKRIGVSRFEAILPRLKRAETDEERKAILEDAEVASVIDLSPHGETRVMTVYCIECGNEVAVCPKCHAEIKVKYRKEGQGE